MVIKDQGDKRVLVKARRVRSPSKGSSKCSELDDWSSTPGLLVSGDESNIHRPRSPAVKTWKRERPLSSASKSSGLESVQSEDNHRLELLRTSLELERSAVVAELEARHDQLLRQMFPAFDQVTSPAPPAEEPPTLLAGTPVQVASSLKVVAETSLPAICEKPEDSNPKIFDLPGSLTEKPQIDTERHIPDFKALESLKENRRQTPPHSPFNQRRRSLHGVEYPDWHPAMLVRHTLFDAFFCFIIVLNVIQMSFELHYRGKQVGYEIGFPKYSLPAAESWPQAKEILDMSENFFGALYALEILLKVIGYGKEFVNYIWHWLDTIIVLFWIVDRALPSLASIPPSMIRLVRMARLLRLVRLVKTVQGFDALYIMTTAIVGSLQVLLWSFLMLLLVQTTIAFALNQYLEPYMTDANNPIEARRLIFEYFGTASRSLFTMFELALGDWQDVARILQENVSEYYMFFSLGFKLLIGFAVVGVINGVFMQETFNVAASDDRIMLRKRQLQQKSHVKKMETFFAHADESGDGFVDLEEFKTVLGNDEIRSWLAAQDLSVDDADHLFELLDDGDQKLSASEVVIGVDRLKGSARSIDFAIFMREYRTFAEAVSEKLELPKPSPLWVRKSTMEDVVSRRASQMSRKSS